MQCEHECKSTNPAASDCAMSSLRRQCNAAFGRTSSHQHCAGRVKSPVSICPEQILTTARQTYTMAASHCLEKRAATSQCTAKKQVAEQLASEHSWPAAQRTARIRRCRTWWPRETRGCGQCPWRQLLLAVTSIKYNAIQPLTPARCAPPCARATGREMRGAALRQPTMTAAATGCWWAARWRAQ